MKTPKEIKEFLFELEEDIYDCMTMPCDTMEKMQYDHDLEALATLMHTHDNLLISTIKQYVDHQDMYEFDYERIWRWINA